MMLLLEQFWKNVQAKIIWRLFLPYLLYATLAIVYFYVVLMDTNYEVDYAVKKTMGSLTLVGLIYTAREEVFQLFHAIREKNVCNYFSSLVNWIDIICIVLSLLVTIHTLAESEVITLERLRLLAAFTSCFLIFKFYDWLRVFDK